MSDKQILVDADKFEHLLNCMAQLDFLPLTGMHADEPIIRQAYLDAREMLHNPVANACSPPTSPKEERLREALVKLWKHTPKIDNGMCMVCRIGYASLGPDVKKIGELKVGKCDRDDCLSHVITKALAE